MHEVVGCVHGQRHVVRHPHRCCLQALQLSCTCHSARLLRHIRTKLGPDVAKIIAPSSSGFRLDYCNALFYNIYQQRTLSECSELRTVPPESLYRSFVVQPRCRYLNLYTGCRSVVEYNASWLLNIQGKDIKFRNGVP